MNELTAKAIGKTEEKPRFFQICAMIYCKNSKFGENPVVVGIDSEKENEKNLLYLPLDIDRKLSKLECYDNIFDISDRLDKYFSENGRKNFFYRIFLNDLGEDEKGGILKCFCINNLWVEGKLIFADCL